jgi:hypothetical protein
MVSYTEDLTGASPSSPSGNGKDDEEWRPSVDGDKESEESFEMTKKRTCKKAKPVQDPLPEKLELMKALHITNEELENTFKTRNIQYFLNKLPRAGNKDVGDSTAAGTSTIQSNNHLAS